MTKTLTAMFDTRADAEAARERLLAAGIGADDVHVVDQSTPGYSADRRPSTTEDKGIWASIKGAFLPDEDRHTYEEGVHRGGAVLTAHVSDDHADEAVHVLDNANSVDLDGRTQDWASTGWNDPMASRGFDDGIDNRRDTMADVGRDTAMDTGREGEAIPIVEEQLVVGKRAYERGGVRVRSYVVETPVSEQVGLLDEHVTVERRRVDLPLREAGDVFRERTIAMTETAEEAVVGKSARVVEEVVLRKQTGQRTETVSDSVRRTEVEVENLDTTTARAGIGGDTLNR